LTEGDSEIEIKVLVAFVNISGNSSVASEFVAAGAVEAIVKRMDSSSIQVQELALQAVQNLAIGASAHSALERAGAGQKVAAALRGGRSELLLHALRATTNLCCSDAIRRAMKQEGSPAVVERYTRSPDPTVAESAKQALNNLSI